MRVLLIVAPFGLIEYPNLAASLLKALAEREGFPCKVQYCSLEFAQRIGWDPYRTCYYSDSYLLLGERIFARALFGEQIPSWTRYWNEVMAPYERPNWRFMRPPEHEGANRRSFELLEDEALDYVEQFSARRELESHDLFAFTTSYSQNLASLAIARRLKERFPAKPVIFGGANCHGVMGEQLLRSFDFIDYVCTAEGDRSFPAFLRCLEQGKAVSVAGILGRSNDGKVPRAGPAELVGGLDGLPFPDFTDFFAAFHFRPGENAEVAALPMEASRGCWWGEKHHCTFCGLNGETMRFRSKSPARVAEEVKALVRRYSVPRIMMADNILDTRSVRELREQLGPQLGDLEIFFEAKANLGRGELGALVDSGITFIQAGIESLSTHVLELMDKGCDSFQNLQLLKWTKELGIAVAWNLLCGFPGETDEDYAELGRLLPKIYHLAPARGFGQISIDRFSPMFNAPERYGIRVQPLKAYRYVYPLPQEQIRNLAYAFSFASERGNTWDSMAAPPYARQAYHAWLVWKRFCNSVDFSFEQAASATVLVHDTRPGAQEEWRELEAVAGQVFLSLDSAHTAEAITRILEREHGTVLPAARLDEILESFERRNYLHTERGKYLVLANRRPPRQRAGGFRSLKSSWRAGAQVRPCPGGDAWPLRVETLSEESRQDGPER